MSNSERSNPAKEMENATLPLGAPVPEGCLLEANARFHNEILTFRPHELLSECK